MDLREEPCISALYGNHSCIAHTVLPASCVLPPPPIILASIVSLVLAAAVPQMNRRRGTPRIGCGSYMQQLRARIYTQHSQRCHLLTPSTPRPTNASPECARSLSLPAPARRTSGVHVIRPRGDKGAPHPAGQRQRGLSRLVWVLLYPAYISPVWGGIHGSLPPALLFRPRQRAQGEPPSVGTPCCLLLPSPGR